MLKPSFPFYLGYSPSRGASTLQRSTSQVGKPPPPIRRTSSISSQNGETSPNSHTASTLSRTSSFKGPKPLVNKIDDDATPHGSIENISPMPADNPTSMETITETLRRVPGSPGILRRSTSMSQSPAAASPVVSHFERDPHLRRSLTITNQVERANVLSRLQMGKNSVTFAPTATVHNTDNAEEAYKRVSTHHVIPVSSTGAKIANVPPVPHAVAHKSENKLSPEGEIYGFGRKFRENSRHYFNGEPSNIPSMSFSYPNSNANPPQQQAAQALPMSQEAIQNQRFLDSLSAKLTGSVQQGQRMSVLPSNNNHGGSFNPGGTVPVQSGPPVFLLFQQATKSPNLMLR